MITFNKQLNILYKRCEQYRNLFNNSGNPETATSELVLKLKDKLEGILDIGSGDDSIESLAKKFQCLVDFDELTKGKYEKWANTFESFKKGSTHQELMNKVMAIKKAEVAQFVTFIQGITQSQRTESF